MSNSSIQYDIHEQICSEIHELYIRKNSDYGNSFAQLRERFPNFVCMRIFDKLNRLCTIMEPGYERQVSDETIEDTLLDIANYAIMEVTERRLELSVGEAVEASQQLSNYADRLNEAAIEDLKQRFNNLKINNLTLGGTV